MYKNLEFHIQNFSIFCEWCGIHVDKVFFFNSAQLWIKFSIFNKISCLKKWNLIAQSCPILCNSHGWYPFRLLCPWDSPGKNIGVVSHSLLQGSSQPRDRTQEAWHAAVHGITKSLTGLIDWPTAILSGEVDMVVLTWAQKKSHQTPLFCSHFLLVLLLENKS